MPPDQFNETRKIDFNRIYKVIEDLDLNSVILEYIEKLMVLEFESIERIKEKRKEILIESYDISAIRSLSPSRSKGPDNQRKLASHIQPF